MRHKMPRLLRGLPAVIIGTTLSAVSLGVSSLLRRKGGASGVAKVSVLALRHTKRRVELAAIFKQQLTLPV